MVRFLGAAVLLVAAVPAQATDWYYVDSDANFANISFVDKDSIRADADGNLNASMYSVLAQPEEGVAAYLFSLAVDCKGNRSRLLTGEPFDGAQKSMGSEKIDTPWEAIGQSSQGATIAGFICNRGNGSKSLGASLPFAAGHAMLAEKRKGN